MVGDHVDLPKPHSKKLGDPLLQAVELLLHPPSELRALLVAIGVDTTVLGPGAADGQPDLGRFEVRPCRRT